MQLITNPVESKPTQEILKGINILLKYNPKGDFSAYHEQVFFGDLLIQGINISEEDRALLEELNWFIDEEYYEGEWSHYV